MTRIKPNTLQFASLSSQIATIQDDALRFSQFVSQLSELTDEELARFEITEELQTIHNCLNRFEVHSQIFHIATYEDEFVPPVFHKTTDMNFPRNTNLTSVRREAKHVNKLAGQLTTSLNKIRTGLHAHQDHDVVPEDIVQINEIVGNAVNRIAFNWNSGSD